VARTDEPIVFISESRVRPGMAGAIRTFLDKGAPQLAAAKPETLVFLAYLDAAAKTLTIVHVFADAGGFAAHVEGADSRSAAAAELIETLSLTIYGTPTASTLAAIRASTPRSASIEVRAGFVGGFLRRSTDQSRRTERAPDDTEG
jgi:hypothetical protein